MRPMIAGVVFIEQWSEYLAEHPDVYRLVDPEYVAFEFPGLIPPTFAGDVAAEDVRMGVVATQLANGATSSYVFRVANHAMGAMFVGCMKGLHPACSATLFCLAGANILVALVQPA